MASAFNSQFTALFVETPDFGAATPENRQRLIENRALAEQLGAQIETVYGEDIPYQIAEFARLSRGYQNCSRAEYCHPEAFIWQNDLNGAVDFLCAGDGYSYYSRWQFGQGISAGAGKKI